MNHFLESVFRPVSRAFFVFSLFALVAISGKSLVTSVASLQFAAALSAPIANQQVFSYGSLEKTGTATDWSEFTSKADHPIARIGSDDETAIRPWIGLSACPTCGASKSQSFSFSGLSVGAIQLLTIYPALASSNVTYSARIVSGSATITQGATFSFPQVITAGPAAVASTPVTIKFVPSTTDVTVEVLNGVTGGTHYLYFDQVVATLQMAPIVPPQPTTTPPITGTSTPPIIPATTTISTSTAQIPSVLRLISAILHNNTLVPLYPAAGGHKVGFFKNSVAKTVEAYDENNVMVWSIQSATSSLLGGFDLNNDGTTDFALVKSVVTGTCGTSITANRSLEIRSGATGAILTGVAPFADICFPTLGYAVERIGTGAIESGDTPGIIAITPSYWPQGWFFKWQNNSVTSIPYLMPNTISFDLTYPSSMSPPGLPGQKYVQDSAPENGMILGTKFTAFSSARISQYDTTQYSASQLLTDNTFRARPDIGGRTYGVFSIDPLNKSFLSDIEGTPVSSVYLDMVNAKRANDPWASIERNLFIFNHVTNQLQDRFFSYAHDNADANQYVARPAYAAHVWLPSIKGKSHVVYSVYNENGDNHWNLHISFPGSTADQKIIKDVLLWDARDLNGDGKVELIYSPVETATNSDFYMPSWKTIIATWDPITDTFVNKQVIEGKVPRIGGTFMEPTVQNNSGQLQTLFTGDMGGFVGLYMTDQATHALILESIVI